jgi:hypothetical protein
MDGAIVHSPNTGVEEAAILSEVVRIPRSQAHKLFSHGIDWKLSYAL